MEGKLNIENLVEVTVVLPAFNEVEILEETIVKTNKALQTLQVSYEIIIAEDGSTDGTAILASRLAKQYSHVRHIHQGKRLGRGIALRHAFKKSRGKIIVYLDVDLSTDMKHLSTLIDVIRDGYDIATGSRLLSESKVIRSFSRRLISRLYNFFVRVLLRSRLKDHQCGFKAFRRDPLLKLIDSIFAEHWFWDTEVLVRALNSGYKIKEIPVEWTDKRKTKVNLFKDSIDMGIQVLHLWWTLKPQ